jgi:ComF family protein
MAALRFSASLESRHRVVVPVPLARDRERERGFNQAAVIAASLARHWQCRLATDVLFRVRETPSQTRLTPLQRLANVADAFRIDHLAARRIASSMVVLVDDVLTTGATLNACTRELVQAGVSTICYLTFARARDPRDGRQEPGQTTS